ncbi:N-acetylmuramoyl-L-alanine amidase [Oscillospiraceae bacterium MB08-C2-2]|nr:N-acetylmuramoyl-L-alanine amidase [Oscillospiraceae bacterium MB08-C2-2]
MKILTILVSAALVIGAVFVVPTVEARTSSVTSAASAVPKASLAAMPVSAMLSGKLPIQNTAVGSQTVALDLSISTTFSITRPTSTLTTTYKTYFITGTSDPSQPVYMGDTEIQRTTSNGLFGVLVNLESGNNTFTFQQGDKTQSVTIKRVGEPSGSSPITKITQSSMTPAVMSGVEYGDNLSVGCVAPAGATVTASFGGQSVTLEQVAAASSNGIPATFKGEIPITKEYEAGTVTKAGQVTYTLSYNGNKSTYKSTGEVYVAGQGARITLEVSSYAGFVYPDVKDLSSFREYLKQGSRDTVKSQDNSYFELSSGGFVPKDMVSIVLGKGGVSNSIGSAQLAVYGKQEVYTLTGTDTPAYFSRIDGSTLKLTLFNSSGAPAVSGQSSSKMFSSSSVSEENGAVTYTFNLKEGKSIWGYSVSFDGKNTLLTLRYKPSVDTSSSTPFANVTVMLDPGHGGKDGGALGVAGKLGPTESTLNLAHAYAVRDKLEALGATVVMTRDDDSYVSLDDRLKMMEETRCDVFISLHHNAIAESTDANTVSGLEGYYHQNLSNKLANSLLSSISSGMGRTNRKVVQSYYRVTLLPAAPSVLVELGFLSNPVEYTNATSQSQMKQVADSLANGLKAALQ